MKEFENKVDLPREELIHIEQQIKIKHKQIGVRLMKPGQKLWGLRKGELREIAADEYEEVAIMPDKASGKTMQYRKKLVVDPETFYVVAINKENALRKLQNYLKPKIKARTIQINKK